MPVTVVVGGQYGSEGKGRVAAHLAKTLRAQAVVRCGGANSGHTVYDDNGRRFVFRHLPTACLQPEVKSIIAAGSYINVEILLKEIGEIRARPDSIYIDPRAVVIGGRHCFEEGRNGLIPSIGSTGSGTGAAVIERIQRSRSTVFAADVPELSQFIRHSDDSIQEFLESDARVIVEGTQGFGLSILHSDSYPYVTSRDTTAAGFISECGISPLEVDDVTLVIRSFPIRVSGNSGPLPFEIDWATLSQEANMEGLEEYTSVTNKLRRVARFDPSIVRRAIIANRPTRIVLNHLDYVRYGSRFAFMRQIEEDLNARIDLIGLSATGTLGGTP